MNRLSGWTVAGILLAMLLGTIEAFADCQLARGRRRFGHLYPSAWFD